MKMIKFVASVLLLTSLVGCVSESDIKEILKKDPTVLTEAIKANPTAILNALREASKLAQAEQGKDRQKKEEQELEKAMENPLKPVVDKSVAFIGDINAPIVLVEYSDFECPYCARGYNTVMSLKKKYGKKILFIYKHLPLSFHPKARPSAEYFEALRTVSEKMAFKFHDALYEDQKKVKSITASFKAFAKKNGLNAKKLSKIAKSAKVAAKIKADETEAAKFGMRGTPGFIINGVPVRGAYPPAYFEKIISTLQAKGKLKL
ncbi:MAG: thioredoxin domain-containing protein [Bacteriovoracaceae bacterium]|nr:thioredoxin domain-containing protein [Bacteriovoracaceae bacterium]